MIRSTQHRENRRIGVCREESQNCRKIGGRYLNIGIHCHVIRFYHSFCASLGIGGLVLSANLVYFGNSMLFQVFTH